MGMPLHERSISATQHMSAEERAGFGCLILGTRKWVRAVRQNTIHIWLPDLAPSVSLLEAVHLKRKDLLACSGSSDPFLRKCLTPEALQEWERYWFDDFAPRYRQELHSRLNCRVVTYSGKRTEAI